MKILKKGGSREKGGGANEIHAPCACGCEICLFITILDICYLKIPRNLIVSIKLKMYSHMTQECDCR